MEDRQIVELYWQKNADAISARSKPLFRIRANPGNIRMFPEWEPKGRNLWFPDFLSCG